MLALCRAGTDLSLIGPEHAALQNLDVVQALEAWRVGSRDHGSFGYENEPAWPRAGGDALVLERIEDGDMPKGWRPNKSQVAAIREMVASDDRIEKIADL